MIAKVLVDVPIKAVDRLFDYAIPERLIDALEIGMRVIVPFGQRQLMGYCLEITETSDFSQELKPILSILDLESYLTPELIQLAKSIHEETATVLIKVIETILPAALRITARTKLVIENRASLPQPIQPFFEGKSERYLDPDLSEYVRPIKEAVRNGSLRQMYEFKSKAAFRTVRFVKVGNDTKAPKTMKQQAVVDFLNLQESKSFPYQKLVKELSISSSVLDTMEKNCMVKIEAEEQYRKLFSMKDHVESQITLNEEQKKAFERIMEKIDTNQVFLLHGVTSSGKTEIYLKTIEEVLKKGKEVILLVPEISLTPMMVSRFKSRFVDQVAVLHSGLSIGEKFDEWRKIIRKEVKIAIGARSACFAPFTNLGLLVVDECHESTYKQDEMPKYYAIDVVTNRAKTYQVPVILGSATPNIESYARYRRGYYELLTLSKRALNSSLPSLELVDMKQEFKDGNSGLFSQNLIDAIQTTLNRHEQIILLMNRRGYSTFVICRNCGHVFTCPQCDISLTYHETDHTLKCHYCNHKEDVPKTCSKCGSDDLRYFGSGTQKIEAELDKLFPTAKVVRMDNDTTRTKNAHEKLLFEFEETGDILLGTQMIAKGLDFPRVTLVGIIQADGNLYSPDFRAPEKTFQLITQVSGRSGRRNTPGKVIIQAFNPNHYAIQYSFNNDYIGFYEHEMRLRKLAKYVPFYFLVQILFVGEKVRDLFIAAKEAVTILRKGLSDDAIVLGPSLPLVAKVKNKYSFQIIIKYKQETALNTLLFTIREQYENEMIHVTIDRSPTLS